MKRRVRYAGLVLAAAMTIGSVTSAAEAASRNGNSGDGIGAEVVLTLEEPEVKTISWDPSWPYAEFSQIHTGSATLYRAQNSNGFTVCVNAGHGTAGGESVRTLCHPDGTPKVTGGSTAAGETYAISVSGGTTMLDGTPESAATLQIAMILKEKLLNTGFNVLMIREGNDVQLDNIARSVMANQNADCHIALHYDSSESDKGFFCTIVPDIASYKAMEPVASHWREHNALGQSVISGVLKAGNHIWSNGLMEMDLTQTSYSTVPSIDVECGDRASDWSYASQERIAEGITLGLQEFFGTEYSGTGAMPEITPSPTEIPMMEALIGE